MNELKIFENAEFGSIRMGGAVLDPHCIARSVRQRGIKEIQADLCREKKYLLGYCKLF